jgi:hypothetical protein
MNVNSTDNSVNIVSGVSGEQLAGFINQVRGSMAALPQERQQAIAQPPCLRLKPRVPRRPNQKFAPRC